MARQQFRLARHDVGEPAFKRIDDPCMDGPTRFSQQRAIGGVLHQRMIEEVCRVGRRALAKQQAGRNQPVQRPVDLSGGFFRNGCQQGVGEFTADRRTDLGHILGFAQPIEPRQQRCLQGGRHGVDRGTTLLGFQHRLGHLLHEQWDAVGTVEDVATNVRRQHAAGRQPVDHGARLGPRQPVAVPSRCRPQAVAVGVWCRRRSRMAAAAWCRRRSGPSR